MIASINVLIFVTDKT